MNISGNLWERFKILIASRFKKCSLDWPTLNGGPKWRLFSGPLFHFCFKLQPTDFFQKISLGWPTLPRGPKWNWTWLYDVSWGPEPNCGATFVFLHWPTAYSFSEYLLRLTYPTWRIQNDIGPLCKVSRGPDTLAKSLFVSRSVKAPW